jgi:hypothetical protein
MLVQDIVKFFIFLVVVAVLGDALNHDACTYYGDTEIMQTDWANCKDYK